MFCLRVCIQSRPVRNPRPQPVYLGSKSIALDRKADSRVTCGVYSYIIFDVNSLEEQNPHFLLENIPLARQAPACV